ncbi:MAG: hypothetical protein J0H54_08840 [Rhizobiales bacterium]|nr:hypothetical protein [Hyphomicrobiales bacterium]
MQKKLTVLRSRLVEQQQKLISQAALADGLPTEGAIRKISDLENAILAVEHMIEEIGSSGQSKGR